jgi:hypothetical protein
MHGGDVAGSEFDPCSAERIREIGWFVRLGRGKLGEFHAKGTAVGKLHEQYRFRESEIEFAYLACEDIAKKRGEAPAHVGLHEKVYARPERGQHLGKGLSVLDRRQYAVEQTGEHVVDQVATQPDELLPSFVARHNQTGLAQHLKVVREILL